MTETESFIRCFVYILGKGTVREDDLELQRELLRLRQLRLLDYNYVFQKPIHIVANALGNYYTNENIYEKKEGFKTWEDFRQREEMKQGRYYLLRLWNNLCCVMLNGCIVYKAGIDYSIENSPPYSYMEFIPSPKPPFEDRQDLIPKQILDWVGEVFGFGATKYSEDNWKSVSMDKFMGAFNRHWASFQVGIDKDDESGLPHIAHAISNLFIIGAKEYGSE